MPFVLVQTYSIPIFISIDVEIFPESLKNKKVGKCFGHFHSIMDGFFDDGFKIESLNFPIKLSHPRCNKNQLNFNNNSHSI